MNVSVGGKASFEVGGVETRPGTKASGTVTAFELVDGTAVECPLVLLAGATPGPTVYIGAAIHGDEINGIGIVHEVIRHVDSASLKGNVICVPMQNPLALRMQHRLPLQLLSKSPMDQFPGDPWMCFPGDASGNSAEVMAHLLFELMRPADVVIDIHTPTTGGRYVPFIFLPHRRTGSVWEETLELAQAFAPDFILAAEEGVYVMDGSLHGTVAEHGTPAFGVELGEGGRLDEVSVGRGTKGVLNVLRHLGMVGGEAEMLGSSRVLRSMTVLRTTRGGLLRIHAELGAEIAEGDLLATVTDRFGDVVESILAPHGGPFMRMTTFPTVSSNERVAQIGVDA